MQCGYYKCNITPRKGVPLAGFGFRKGNFEKIQQDIYVRILVLNNNLIIVHGDILFWDENAVETFRNHFQDFNLICIASHSHSGPQLSTSYSPLLGTRDDEYYFSVISNTIASIKKAIKSQKNIKEVSIGTSACSFVVNRRKNIDGNIEMRPNFSNPVNKNITILKFINAENEKILLINMTCHPTISSENNLSGEFPGYLAQHLEKEHESVFVLQGFCGDCRPALLKNNNFFRGNFDDIVKFGKVLANNIELSLQNMQQIDFKEVIPYLEKNIKFPLKAKYPLEHYKNLKNNSADEAVIYWCENIIDNYDKLEDIIEITIICFKIGTYIFIGVEGEVVYEYDRFINEISPLPVFLMGYINAVKAYIPTRSQLQEGGYESQGSIPYFNMTNEFTDEVEDILKTQIREIALQITNS